MRYAFEPGRIVFTESSGAPLTAGPGCQERQPGTVACGAQVGAEIKVETGDGADAVEPQAAERPGCTCSSTAGPEMTCWPADRPTTRSTAAEGATSCMAAAVPTPSTMAAGHRAIPTRSTEDPGAETRSPLAKRADDLAVDLARSAGPDGDILTGLEGIEGGSGDDRLVASNRSTGVLRGGKGRDTLRGRARGDHALRRRGTRRADGRSGRRRAVDGGPGRDRVSGGPGSDDIDTWRTGRASSSAAGAAATRSAAAR